MKTYTLFWSHLPQLFLEWEMFHTDLYIKSKDSLCLLFFFLNAAVYEIMRKDMVQPDRSQMTV